MLHFHYPLLHIVRRSAFSFFAAKHSYLCSANVLVWRVLNLAGLDFWDLIGSGLLGLIGLVIIGLLIILVIRLLFMLIPAALVAVVVWFLTDSLWWAGIAFLVIAALSVLKKL